MKVSRQVGTDRRADKPAGRREDRYVGMSEDRSAGRQAGWQVVGGIQTDSQTYHLTV